jgi:thiamine biosynthesis lipoprotein
MVRDATIVWLLATAVTGQGFGQGQDVSRPLLRFEFQETHMASPFKIVLYSTDEVTARHASRAAYQRIAALNTILSDYDPDSELSRLSRSAGGLPTPVSADLFAVLVASKEIFERSDGAFDITIAPVGRLWRRARRDHRMPDASKLAEALVLVGADKLVLDQKARTARLDKPGMKLDAGGIAKGYAAQAGLDVLRTFGIGRALVAGAGDIVVGDPPPGCAGWTIAVAPLALGQRSPVAGGLLLANCAVSTAGDTEQFVVLEGHRYSHIINPKTGQAVEDRATVTVVARDGATADALETTVYILGVERGLKLVDDTDGAAAVFVRSTPEGIKVFESSRFKEIPRAPQEGSPAQERRL